MSKPPNSLVEWARREVHKLPAEAHPSGDYEVIEGVTIGDLREWLRAIDAASTIRALSDSGDLAANDADMP